MTPGGDWCPIKTVHCNYCGGIPPVAAQRCWRVETIAGLTGLLQRTLQNIKNTMLVLVIICTIIIRTLQSIKSVIITILTCRSRPSCCWWAWKEAGGRSVACKLDPIQASTFFTSSVNVSMIRASNWFSSGTYCSMHENVSMCHICRTCRTDLL